MYHQTGSERDELRARFTKWMETMVYRARIDYIRKNQNKLDTVSLEELPEAALPIRQEAEPRFGDDVGKGAFDFEEERLAEAFSELSPARQHILTMLFVEEKNSDEIARELHCTVQHVYNQRSLALKKLRAILEKEGEGQ